MIILHCHLILFLHIVGNFGITFQTFKISFQNILNIISHAYSLLLGTVFFKKIFSKSCLLRMFDLSKVPRYTTNNYIQPSILISGLLPIADVHYITVLKKNLLNTVVLNKGDW